MKMTIAMPSYEDLKNPKGFDDYFKVDAEKFGVVENTMFSIGVTYEPAEGEELPDNLPGQEITKDSKLSGITLKPGIEAWLKENITGKLYVSTFMTFMFEKEEDAVLFKVTWG